MAHSVTVRLFGALQVIGSSGVDITPRGSKARGLLALLCDDPGLRRARRWIESRLWSDRSPEQASGSLRQTLVELRRAFGEDYQAVIGSDRLDVWLDPTRVTLDLSASGGAEWREVLEGLDVRDEAFEDWLRAFRARYSGSDGGTRSRPVPERRGTGLSIRAAMSEAGSSIERLTGQIIADQVAQGVEERLSSIRFAGFTRPTNAAADLEIRCDVAETDGGGLVFLRIEHGADARVVFSGHRAVQGGLAGSVSAETVGSLVNTAVAKITQRMPSLLDPARPEAIALGHARQGIEELSKFTPGGLEEAKDHFSTAFKADDNGVFLAWQAFVRMAQLVEGAPDDARAWLDEVRDLTHRSLSRSRENGLAVALVALTRIMLEDDLSGPADLALKAIRHNSHGVFAKQTLAVAHSAVGEVDKAYALSTSCRLLMPENELGHLWDLYHALVCIGAGKLDEARSSAERSASAAPSFVAPRRQLIALCANAGDIGAARTYLAEVGSLEKGFSLDRYLNDPAYPVLTLRRAGLLDPLKRSPLSD